MDCYGIRPLEAPTAGRIPSWLIYASLRTLHIAQSPDMDERSPVFARHAPAAGRSQRCVMRAFFYCKNNLYCRNALINTGGVQAPAKAGNRCSLVQVCEKAHNQGFTDAGHLVLPESVQLRKHTKRVPSMRFLHKWAKTLYTDNSGCPRIGNEGSPGKKWRNSK